MRTIRIFCKAMHCLSVLDIWHDSEFSIIYCNLVLQGIADVDMILRWNFASIPNELLLMSINEYYLFWLHQFDTKVETPFSKIFTHVTRRISHQ
jgi:hypothetical protein